MAEARLYLKRIWLGENSLRNVIVVKSGHLFSSSPLTFVYTAGR